jgi:hypothetical protein
MNKIVPNYPVDELPENLREGLPEHGSVEIEFRLKDGAQPRGPLTSFVGSLESIYESDQAVIDYIRKMRDEG